jgi:transposase InsO family protein
MDPIGRPRARSRVHAGLRAKGLHVGKKRVARVMRENGLAARRKRRLGRTRDSTHDSPVAPDVLESDLEQDAPNEVRVTDVTYLFTAEGWPYLAVMLDLFFAPGRRLGDE